jgi:hypothetical protein
MNHQKDGSARNDAGRERNKKRMPAMHQLVVRDGRAEDETPPFALVAADDGRFDHGN